MDNSFLRVFDIAVSSFCDWKYIVSLQYFSNVSMVAEYLTFFPSLKRDGFPLLSKRSPYEAPLSLKPRAILSYLAFSF